MPTQGETNVIRTTIVCVAATLAVAGLAVAQATIEPAPLTGFHFVGFSTGTVLGDAGVQGMKAQCQADWPSSRMCSSQEITDGIWTNGETSLEQAWVRASAQPGGFTGLTDVSGLQEVANDMTCAGWERADEFTWGLTVDNQGTFRTRPCDVARPVACCQYGTLVPEPDQTSMWAAGIVLLGALRRHRDGARREG